MRRNALLLALLFVVGLAICWPPSWTKGVLPTVGTKVGRAVLIANHASPRRHDGILLGGASHSTDSRTAGVRNRIAENYGKLPLSFEPNSGQTDGNVRFLSRGPGYTLFLTGDQAVLRLKSKSSIPSRQAPVTRASLQRGGSRKGQSTLSEPQKKADAVLSMQLVGANPKVITGGTDELPGKSNYFIGSDPQKWRTHVPTYARVKYSNVYPGVDLVYYGNQSGQLEYDFVVAPGANPAAIVLSVAPGVQQEGQNSRIGNQSSAGRTAVRIAPDGDLLVHLRDGDVRLHKPLVYQGNSSFSLLENLNAHSGYKATVGESRTIVESHYVLSASNQVRFDLGPYDHTRPLCIDPILYYSTYMGGAVSDTGNGIAIDSNGDAYIAGTTSSPSFPNAANSLNGTAQDAFITELNPTGTAVVYYTYLGGTGADAAYGVAVDSLSNAYVTGVTYSGDFPTVNPLPGSVYNNPPAGYTGRTGPNSYAVANGTGFVAELPVGGASLLFSTYLGGSKGSGGVTGVTAAAGDIARGIAVDPACTSSSCVDVTGTTLSADFPVTSSSNTYETYPLSGAQAAFVTKLNWNGSTLTTPYSTLLGGISMGDMDAGNAIAVDSSGNIYVTGQTHSPDFPSVNSLPSTDYGSTSSGYIRNWGNAFITELNPETSSLLFSTFLGGNTGYGDSANGIAVDPNGNIYVAGLTYSEDFPHPNAFPGTTPTGTKNTYADTEPCDTCSPYGTGFVAEINPWETPAALAYSTYLGGSSGTGDSAQAIAVDEYGDAYVVGTTRSANFPTAQNMTYSSGNFFNNSTLPGASATFASEISANGAGLLVSTYLGGSGSDAGNAVAIDAAGDMFLTGSTSSPNFPTAAPYIPAPTNQQEVPYQGTLLASGSHSNAFVAMIQASAFANLAVSTAGAPDCAFNNSSTSSCTFTAAALGQPSGDSPEVITVVNNGNAPATFNSITIIPSIAGSTDFSLTPASNCPTGSTLLPPGAGCAVSITFAPAAPVQNETATLQIDYNNDGVNNAGGVAPVQTVNLTGSTNITGVPTTTVVTSSAPPVFPAGTLVTFTATVTVPSTGLPAPGGTMNFVIDGKVVATGVPVSAGTAAYSTSSLTGSGSPYTIVAMYSGGTFSGTAYNKSTGSLDPSLGTATTTKVSSSLNPSTYGASVTFTATVTVTNGGAAVPAGNTVQFSIDGTNFGSPVSVVSGGTATSQSTSSLSVGTHTIVATYSGGSISGSGTYISSTNAALYPFTQTVNMAPLTTTASSGSMTYGGTVPTITASYSGFVNGDSASSLTTQPTCSTAATSSSPVSGSPYQSSCTGAADSNYTISYVNGTVTVGTATLNITASGGSFTYGGTPPTITASYSGFVNGDTYSSLTGQPTCSTAATSSSPVGSYASSCSGASDGNYTITYTPGTVTVNPASLTITASSGTMTYGGTPPAITASYTYGSVVNSSTPPSGLAPPTCSTTATSASTVGNSPYLSSCSGAVNANYTISYVNGSVTVTAIAPTVAAVGGTFAYNGNQEAASATALGIGNATVSGTFAFTYSGTGSTTYGPSSTPPSSAGTYSVAVLFTSTDSDYSSGSAITAIVITPATPATVVLSSENPSTFGDSVTFTATVSSSAGTPTGTVQFVVDGANFGSAASLSGATAISPATTSLTPGEHVVTAVYSGDANFSTSTSPFLIQVVNNPLASIAVTPANPSIFISGTQQFVATGTFTDTTAAILPTGGTWAVENSMTNGVRAPMSAGSNGLLYYFGGQDSGGAENYVQTYNPATGAWSSGASMTTARYQGVAVAPGNGLIYVMGGWNNSAPTNVVEVYDPVGNTWKSETSLGHSSACSVGGAINGLIYVLTGCDGSAGNSNEFDVYNPVTNTWTSLTSPAHNHNSGAGGVIGGKFYVAGGYDASTATGITEVYDPQTSTWTTASAMPAQLGELGGAAFSGNLYVVGGLDNSSNPQPEVYLYNPPTDTWSTLNSSLSAGRRDIGVVAFDGLLYAAGGYTSADSNTLEVLDTDDVTWSSDTTSVATVDPNAGLATGATAGTANITAASAVYAPVSGSTVLTVLKQNQTITFGPLSNVTYGIAPFPISATDSASLLVTFTSNSALVCTVSGGALSGNATSATVTILSAGSCSITASQAGTSNYLAATSVPASFTVNPAPLTITASSGTMTYGGTVPTITASYSGFVSGDSASSLTPGPTCSTQAMSNGPVGSYASNCAGASDPNYTISYVPGSVTVNPAPLTIMASNASKTYGGTVPTITASYSGFVNGQSSSVVTGTTCSTTATATSPVGSYPSTCTGATAANYTITPVNGSVSVTAAALTVTASSGTMTYGGTVPTITPSYSGFVNGQGSSVVSGTTCSTTATAGSAVGSYPSTCTGATAANYTITPVNGTVSVTAAALTVTASSGTMTYGGTVPTITPSYSGFVNGQGSSVVHGNHLLDHSNTH